MYVCIFINIHQDARLILYIKSIGKILHNIKNRILLRKWQYIEYVPNLHLNLDFYFLKIHMF